ncbi:helicase protein MOM1-like [Bidens hawaiensis]|uniref:helicase protein MOM1-like n=1 Tax=Bidens hawaiensis TaxID=980011 RepID=UPI00404ADF18
MKKSRERPTPQEHEDTDIKNLEKESLKMKKRNAHFYKMLFKKTNVKNKTPAAESCSHKKQRLCSEQGCEDQPATKYKIQSGNNELAEEVSTGIHNHGRDGYEPDKPLIPEKGQKRRLCSGDQSAIDDKIESGSSECKFSEYWVPAHLSSMQIEQYCAILSSNTDTLSALPRKSSLNDIITQIQKCCDHPYLADPTLPNSAKEASLTADPLAADINVSGKLHVFDKLLLEIKQCGLKALVLFQSAVNSEKISTGHILDDVHQRFGENSYVYLPGNKKECLETFNNADSEWFVCLCDYRACHSSIRLSRVDVVIIFNSDRNPSNDIKALNKITIDSPCERVNVFRLYLPFTVEEKALILSKVGTVVDSYISSSVCHQLLAWGAPYLFSKVHSTDSGPQAFLDDLLHELSSLLRNTNVKPGPTDRSIISNAQMQNGAYSKCIKLFGETESHTKESASAVEYLVANSPSDFWSNLVKESETGPEKSRKKLSRRVRKPNQNCIEGENAATTPFFVRSKQRSKRKYLKDVGRKPAACENATPSSISDSIALNPGTNGGQQSQPEQLPPHTLEKEVGTNGGQQSQPEQPPPHTLEKVGTNGGQQSQPKQPPPHTLEKVGTIGGQ